MTQTSSAVRNVFTGSVSDLAFSADSSLLYAVTGSTIRSFDPSSGAMLAQYQAGQELSAFDISPDGRFVVALVNPVNPLIASNASFVRLDTTTGQITTFDLPIDGQVKAPFHDLAYLADGTLLLSQRNTAAPLVVYDFSTDSTTATGASFLSPTLVVSRDHTEVFVIDGSVFGKLAVYTADAGIVATYIANPDPYAGAGVPPPPLPVGAISPDSDSLVLGANLTVFDTDLVASGALGSASIPSAAGMDFGSSAETLLIARFDTVLAIDASTGKLKESFPLGISVANPYDAITGKRIGFGDILKASQDGKYAAVITTNGISLLSLEVASSASGSGDDVLVEGTLLYGLGGNDILGGPEDNQYMYGGPGDDTYRVGQFGDRVFENPDEGHDRVLAAVSFELPPFVEDLKFTGTGDALLVGNDDSNLIEGGPGNDRLYGYDGNDTLLGNDGDDELDGGAGADDMRGGKGDDIYFVDDPADLVTEMPGEGIDEIRTDLASFTLPVEVERLRGILYGPQTLIGNDAANVLISGPEGDQLIGKAGDDHYFVTNPDDAVIEESGEGHDTVYTEQNGLPLAANVEDLVLIGSANYGIGNDSDNVILASGFGINTTLMGLGGNDRLETFDGNDTLDGGAGTDTMIGGKGNDRYIIDSLLDVIVENPGEGIDEVVAPFGYTLAANFENLTLIGSAVVGTGNSVDNVLVGNELPNTLLGLAGNDRLEGVAGDDRLEGGAGDDYLDGGAGADTMIGGLGNDTYRVDDPGDVVFELANEGNDLIESSVSLTLPDDIENLRLIGFAPLEGRGNSLGNKLFANVTGSSLYGGGGNDELYGVGGNLLDGGDGTDVAVFFGPSFAYLVTPAQPGSVELGQPGIPNNSTNLLVDIEIIRFSNGDFVWSSEAQQLIAIDNGRREFDLILPDNFVGSVGGDGRVFGTVGAQDISLSGPGRVDFDASFNRGGDTIRLPGNAGEWSALIFGSTVTITNGETIAKIPVGPNELTLVFADGARGLHYDSASEHVSIGGQALTRSIAFIDVPPDALMPSAITATEVPAMALLMPRGSITIGGNAKIFGTAEMEQVTVLSGGAVLDPSFNRGGETVHLSGDAEEFTAQRFGATVRLSSDELAVTIPVGLSNLILDFDDGPRDLFYNGDLNSIMIGNQVIPTLPVQIGDLV